MQGDYRADSFDEVARQIYARKHRLIGEAFVQALS